MQVTIQNEHIKLTVDTYGAEMRSVQNASGEEMLWQPCEGYWNRQAIPLFPWTGPLKEGYFEVDGKRYESGIHGFAQNLEHAVCAHEADTLVLELCANDVTRAMFPFEFSLVTTYRLVGQAVRHTMAVKNTGDTTLQFGLGYHPAFQVPFDAAHQTSDYEVRFDRVENPMILTEKPSGELSGTVRYLGTNMTYLPMKDGMFDHQGSHCLVNLASEYVGIYEKDSGRNIRLNIKAFPYTLLWSTNTPAEKELKFLCIEPWHSIPSSDTDSPLWSDKPAAAILAPEQVFEANLEMVFDR